IGFHWSRALSSRQATLVKTPRRRKRRRNTRCDCSGRGDLSRVFPRRATTISAASSPPPLAGEGQGGGIQYAHNLMDVFQPPPPQPSPASGGGSRPRPLLVSDSIAELCASARERQAALSKYLRRFARTRVSGATERSGSANSRPVTFS